MPEHRIASSRIPWHLKPVHLDELDTLQNSQPIFTRELLQQTADSRDLILKSRSNSPILAKSLDGKDRVIWKGPARAPRDDDEEECVQVMYLTYPEMSAEYLRAGARLAKQGTHFGGENWSVLRGYNSGVEDSEKEKLAVPVFLSSLTRKKVDDTTPEWNAALHALREQCHLLKSEWERSKLCRKMKRLFIKHANDTIPIKKIVCFGLGSMANDDESILQHLAISTIAEALDSVYMSQDHQAEPVKIILQDPWYSKLDIAVSADLLSGTRPVTFVDDPDGILAIDSNSLVVAPHIPVTVPLMQIIADLFWDDLSKAPVGFISDNIGSVGGKKTFTASDRVTPRVEAMLQSYDEIWDCRTLREWSKLPAYEKEMHLWFLDMFTMLKSRGYGHKRTRGAESPLSEELVSHMY